MSTATPSATAPRRRYAKPRSPRRMLDSALTAISAGNPSPTTTVSSTVIHAGPKPFGAPEVPQ